MSSPTPEGFALQAERARKRAERSRLVMKLAAVAGVAFAAVLIGQSLFFKPVPAPPAPPTPEKATIIKGGVSTFSGIDVNSKPFTVQAQEGVQDAQNEALMHLKSVTGQFVRKEGGAVQVTADAAEYETRSKDLRVRGNVRFEEPGRYVARLSSAEVNLEQQRITTNEPVQVDTGGATVSADSMETSDDGKVVSLRGHVKANFTQGVSE